MWFTTTLVKNWCSDKVVSLDSLPAHMWISQIGGRTL